MMERNHQPIAVVSTPAAARSSFLRSRATLNPVKIFVHAAGRGPTCSSAMRLLLRGRWVLADDGRAGGDGPLAKGHYMEEKGPGTPVTGLSTGLFLGPTR